MTEATGLSTQMPVGSQADMPAQQGMPGGMQVGHCCSTLSLNNESVDLGEEASQRRCCLLQVDSGRYTFVACNLSAVPRRDRTSVSCFSSLSAPHCRKAIQQCKDGQLLSITLCFRCPNTIQQATHKPWHSSFSSRAYNYACSGSNNTLKYSKLAQIQQSSRTTNCHWHASRRWALLALLSLVLEQT